MLSISYTVLHGSNIDLWFKLVVKVEGRVRNVGEKCIEFLLHKTNVV